MSTREKITIIDVDGTISNPAHRLPLLEEEPIDWDLFYNTAHLDTPIEERIKFIWKFLKETHSLPIFITGRNEVIWDDTVDFIDQYFFKGDKEMAHIRGVEHRFEYEEYWIRMRSEKDRRKAYEMKKSELTDLLKKYHIVGVFDDDEDCRKMYHEELKWYQSNIFYLHNDYVSNKFSTTG